MEIAIVQHDIVAESVERTLSGIESLLAGVEAVDLVVLPEMFATGFDVDDASVAEPASGGAVLRWMQSLAAARRSAVEGSVAVDDNGLRNRHYLCIPTAHTATTTSVIFSVSVARTVFTGKA